MTLSPAVSRFAAVGILLSVVWAVSFFAIMPIAGVIADDLESISRSRQVLDRYEALKRTATGQVSRIDGRPGFLDDRYLIKPASSALQSAEFQNLLQRLVVDSGVNLRSSRTVAPGNENGFDRVGADLDVTASADSLRAFLYALETTEPSVFIERFLAHVPENSPATLGGDNQPSINVSLHVAAYAKPSSNVGRR